jgi:sulfite exporter TauE/SafE
MNEALIVSATLMGLAGTPHCAAMCGVACSPFSRSSASALSFHGARMAGYALAGAFAASSVGLMARFGQSTAALRPLWTLVHVAALALGLWLLCAGRQPAWMAGVGQRASAMPGAWQVVRGPGAAAGLRSAGAGLAWVAWPCGLLQSALMVAALADQAWQGALTMASFAAASALGLIAAPTLWRKLAGLGGGDGQSLSRLAVRAAGVMLAGASAWALGHETMQRVAAWCGVG